jgi:3-deoxy-manno-octulosonate cytidylyltransferase (CMP-KDO synthetase)
MTVLAVIPARLGATRLPGKPLRLLGGVPLVVRVAQRVQALGVADRCVVATDAPEVEAACAAAGVAVVRTRADHPSGTDRVAEVAARPEFADARIVLNVQGDEPFVTAEALAAAVSIVARGVAELGTVAVAAPPDVLQRPDVVKVVLADTQHALYFSRAPIPWLREAADEASRDALVRRHVGVYAYTPAALAAWVALPPHPLEQVERLEQLRPLAHGLAIGVALVADAGAGGIDTEDDLRRATARLASSPSTPPEPSHARHTSASVPIDGMPTPFSPLPRFA